MQKYLLVLLCISGMLKAQDKPLEMKMDFELYDPPSTLVVKEHKLTRSKFPFIDVHNHYGNMTNADLGERVKFMNEMNMAVMVNLSGRGFRGGADHLAKSLDNIKATYANRFILFTNVDFSNIDDPEWSKNAVEQIEQDVKLGAKGLKIYKTLGIHQKDKNQPF
jgi:predicted TIM-barrel fold metal-dependent hydrolase